MRYSALKSTEEEIVSVSDLRDRAGKDKFYNNVENAQELSDKEFINGFNKLNKENIIALDHNEIKNLMIVIQWSEAGLEINKAIPFGEANAMMSNRIEEVVIESEKDKGKYVPYEKARYHLILPKEMDKDFNRMEVITMDRLDLGDGRYKSPYEQILKEKGYLSDEVKQALKQEVNEYEKTNGQSNPEIGEKQQDKVDHFYSKESEQNKDTAASDKQEVSRMSYVAYMHQMER